MLAERRVRLDMASNIVTGGEGRRAVYSVLSSGAVQLPSHIVAHPERLVCKPRGHWQGGATESIGGNEAHIGRCGRTWASPGDRWLRAACAIRTIRDQDQRSKSLFYLEFLVVREVSWSHFLLA